MRTEYVTAEPFGERLGTARRSRGLTLEQVSIQTGIALSYISMLERGGKINPTLSTIRSLARAVGASPAYLLGEADSPLI